jgi:WD40 repeat protein
MNDKNEQINLETIEKTKYYNKHIIKNIHKNSINSIDINQKNNILYSCSDDQLYLTNLNTLTKHCLCEINDSKSIKELTCLKYHNFDDKNDHLFSSNSNILHLYDLNHLKQISKFKFSKDTINTIEINQNNNLIALCDDSGEIKLIDLRANNRTINLTLRKTLSSHSNICFCLKFNPSNDNEFFSGSFDCSIIKWDTRFISKNNKNKPYVDLININELLSSLNSNDHSLLMSTMTPCFVHSIHFNSSLLMCGIENGFCILFDDKLKYMGHTQLQLPNLALTQMVNFQDIIKLDDESKVIDNLITVAGDGKKIEFIYLEKEIENVDHQSKIKIVNQLNIDHKYKINCLKSNNRKLYLADTSNALSIYEYF